MKKVLFIATVVRKHINAFHIPYLKYFKEQGYEVHVCAKDDFLGEICRIPFTDKFFDVDFSRNPLGKNNLKAYNVLKNIVRENDYSIIHCHTPVGGVLGRIASKHSKVDTKVIYTAHGYHFVKKGPLINWLLFFPVEKYLSKYTDDLILINKDDYNLALKHKMGKNIHYIPGVGVDLSKFSFNYKRNGNREKQEEKFILTYIGELTNRKNQLLLIKSMRIVVQTYSDILLQLVGDGEDYEYLKSKIVEYNLDENVVLLGFRKDIPEIVFKSDIILSSSKREGLPVNIMESMATGKPIVLTDCRGNRDLVIHGENGYVLDFSINEFVEAIFILYKDESLRNSFSNKSRSLSKKYDIETILPKYIEVYNR